MARYMKERDKSAKRLTDRKMVSRRERIKKEQEKDKIVLNNKPFKKGTAEILVYHKQKSFLVTLYQPIKQGIGGIWIIKEIK